MVVPGSYVVTDNGTNFVSKVFREVCETMRIQKMQSSPYWPQANGQAERMVRTIKETISCYVHKQLTNWDRSLTCVLFALRATPNMSTGFSPYELVQGRDCMRLPLDSALDFRPTLSDEVSSEYVTQLKIGLSKAWGLAKIRIQASQAQNEKLYNKNVHQRHFDIGDTVFAKRKPIPLGPGWKIDAQTNWTVCRQSIECPQCEVI